MSVLAVIGSTALWLMYAWLASCIVASFVSDRKGWGEKPGLASGLLLAVGGPLLFLLAPPAVRMPLSFQESRPQEPVREAAELKWPVGRVIGFTVLSLGFYLYYWFGTVRQQVSQELRRENDHPGWQTLALILPVVNLVVTYLLWRDIDRLRQAIGLPSFPVLGYVLLTIVPVIGPLIAYPRVIKALNEYWDARTDGAAVEMRASGWEWAAVLLPPVALLVYLVVQVAL